MVFAVIRIRSPRNKSQRMENALKSMRMNKVNHCTLIPQDEIHKGGLKKIKDIVTWGEIDKDTLVSLLKHNSNINGTLTDEYMSKSTEYDSIEEFSEKLLNGEAEITEVPDLKNMFALHPPRGGFKSVKKPYKTGGSLGYRGKSINKILEKMLNDEGKK